MASVNIEYPIDAVEAIDVLRKSKCMLIHVHIHAP